MTVSVRSYLTVGVAALAASAVAVAPVHAATPQAVSNAAVRLSAAVQPLVEPTNAAAAVLGVVSTPAPTPPKPAQTAAGSPSAQAQTQAAVQANNTASNAIDAVYGVVRYWANYFALELAPWALGWVPFGYLISDQIYIWYPTAVLPTVDSFVYDFLDPVVNDPLNPAVWAAGLTAVANTAGNGITTGIQQEINYVLSLQWLPFPIPPLPFAATKPSLPPAATAATAVQKLRSLTSEGTVPTERVRPPAETRRVVPATATAVETTTESVADPTDVKADPTVAGVDSLDQDTRDVTQPDTPKSPSRAMTSSVKDGVKDTANAVRGATRKAPSTAGSARDHSVKKRAAHNSGD